MNRLLSIFIFLALFLPIYATQAQAQDEQQQEQQEQQDSQDPEEKAAALKEFDAMRSSSSKTVRRFHEVLDELLAEFGYDIKLGQIKNLKNVAIRKVQVSRSLPSTYEKYLNLLVAERIRENSKVKLISCIACQTRTSTLIEGKIIVTSPETNVQRMQQIATQRGIDSFMDVVLVYHSTHMVLAFQVFDVATHETLWARAYNSETIKSRFQKLAVDYKQVADSRVSEEYIPDYRLLAGFGGAAIPNVGGTSEDSSMLNFQFRATEKFNNRRTEFGLLLSILSNINSIASSYPSAEGSDSSEDTTAAADEEDLNDGETTVTTPKPKPFSTAGAIYGIYAHNFLGPVESYDSLRHGIHVGAGGLITGGYIAGSGRVGWDIYYGRRFVTSFSGVYIAPSRVLVKNERVKTKGGMGADVVVSFNF